MLNRAGQLVLSAAGSKRDVAVAIIAAIERELQT
jgi:hypothetical protein